MDIATALISFTVAAAILTVTPGLDTALVLRTAAVEGIPIAERPAPPNPYPSPRFRALALFRRRPSRRVDRPVMPASENLHRFGRRLR